LNTSSAKGSFMADVGTVGVAVGRSRARAWLARAAGVVVAAVAATLLVASPAAAAPTPINLFSTSCPAVIQQGQVSGCVTELQNLLNRHGAGLVVDGNFGPNTLYAVRTFQSATAIAVDGQVGPQTKTKLYTTGGTAPAPINLFSASCPTNIARGQQSGCVTELQRLLRRYGYTVGVDGDFGPQTEGAVVSFQSALGLGVDGIVGPITKRALYDSDEAPGAGVDLRSASCPANIAQGQSGGCVATLQALLNGKGQHLSVDGEFGPLTLAAVRAFQQAAGLVVDGIVGPNTKAALYSNIGGGGSSGAPAPINLNSGSCPANISRGQHSGCVTELQSLLNHHGAELAVDGDFGPLTEAAVRDFQAERGLLVDGIVGSQTKGALYGVVTPPASPPPGGGAANMLNVAAAEVGVIEGSARANSYGASVGTSQSTSNYAWCAVFVSWVARQTGATSYRSSWVVNWVTQARNGAYGLSVTSSPAPGDIVAFDWNGGANFTGGNEHIGIVRTISGSSFTTVEGNTGKPGGGPDGVWIKDRGTDRGYDVVFIRVR
jgi:peptidoglycan hydrolase-like protein with peptidoglycan-binding domain